MFLPDVAVQEVLVAQAVLVVLVVHHHSKLPVPQRINAAAARFNHAQVSALL
jgi:hypothetical protein